MSDADTILEWLGVKSFDDIKTEHHEQPRYVYADKSMPVEQLLQKAPVINHTDAELILLESLRGRKPPFVGVAGYSY